MIPNIHFLGKVFNIYQIMTLVGIFTAGPYAMWAAKRRGKDNNDMLVLLLISAIGVFLGMHLLYGITNLPLLIRIIRLQLVTDFRSFLDAVITVFGGSVFYGGLLGGMAAGAIYIHKKSWDLSQWADLVTPAIPLFHFFGRIGCFLGGCCYGLSCSVGFVYHYSPVPGANDVRRFPIQLVEAGCNFLLFLILDRLLRKNRCQGHLMPIYLTCYSILRFLLEFFRGDQIRGFLWGLSTSQWISLLILAGVAIFEWVQRKKSIS